MNSESDNCLKVGAFDPKSSPIQIVAWAEKIIDQDVCDHVGSCRLSTGDVAFYAILDVPCLIPASLRPKCQRPNTKHLFLESKNEISNPRTALNVFVTLESLPSESVRFNQGKTSQGKSIPELTWREVPRSLHSTIPPWRHEIPVTIQEGEALVPANMNVEFKTERLGSQSPTSLKFKPSLTFKVLVPPLSKEDVSVTSSLASPSTGSSPKSQPPHENFEQAEIAEFVSSARSQANTNTFLAWAGSKRPTLAIVFTDIVESTAILEGLKDEASRPVRAAHFAKSRSLISKYNGYEIKTIGDSFFVVFKSANEAFDYSKDLFENTGDHRIKIRAGVHIGPLDVEGSDVFGGEVNFAARVVAAIKGSELWVSDQVKRDLDRLGTWTVWVPSVMPI